MSDVETPVAQLADDPQALLAGLAALEHPPVGVSPWIFVVVAVAILCVLVLGVLVHRWWRRRRGLHEATAWKSAADHALSDLRERVLAAGSDAGRDEPLHPSICSKILADASVLTRRIVLVDQPRANVAPLSGSEWLAELDRLTGDQRFASGAGILLATGPYERSPRHNQSVLLELVDAIELLSDRVVQRQSLEPLR